MQTFLPLPSFSDTASVLDMRRLGKQRIEAKQILMALTGQSSGWKNHPAVKMWRGYEGALSLYGLEISMEWALRGYNDNQIAFFSSFLDGKKIVVPPWIGDQGFHSAHRAALLLKDYGWYSQFGWSECPGKNYVWPHNEGELT